MVIEGGWRLDTHTDMVSQSLPFEKVKHQVSTLDAQPSSPDGGILILVTGALLVCSHLLSMG